MVRDAVSLYCRLGFARKKNAELDSNDLHPSWYELEGGGGGGGGNSHTTESSTRRLSASSDEDDSLIRELNQALESDDNTAAFETVSKDDVAGASTPSGEGEGKSIQQKKIGFLFDSTLTAYLMMGNLSPVSSFF